MPHLKITIAELAHICGVSPGTVDRALNGRTDINAETKQKILIAAKHYGYREFIKTKNTPENRGQIGIIVFNLKNEYFSRLIMEIELTLRSYGLSAVIMMTHYDKQYEIECIRNMYNMGVKGIVICAINHGKDFDNYLKLFNIPIVAVGNDIGSVPYVGIDDFSAMKELTLKALSKGFSNLIYFSPALIYKGVNAQTLRYEGFLSAAVNTNYTVLTDIDKIKENYDDKTAIICSTDYYAFQVYLKAKNTKIIGFDNLDAIEKYNMKIDSVGYSIPDIAKSAVDIIISNKSQGVTVEHRIIEHE